MGLVTVSFESERLRNSLFDMSHTFAGTCQMSCLRSSLPIVTGDAGNDWCLGRMSLCDKSAPKKLKEEEAKGSPDPDQN